MKNNLSRFASWYFSRQAAPYWVVLWVDCTLILFSGILSFFLVYPNEVVAQHIGDVLKTMGIFLPGYLLGMRLFHTYSGIVRYSNSVDLLRICGAIATGTVIAFGIHRLLIIYPQEYYNVRSLVLVLMFFISTCATLGIRMMVKFMYDTILYSNSQQRAFVYGVHEGGEALGRSIISDKQSPYVLSGYVSDEEGMHHHRMMGVRVYKLDDNLINVMRARHIRVLFVSPLRNEALRENPTFLNALLKNGIKVMMQPAEMEWEEKGELNPQQLHQVDIEDLLPRDKIEIDLKNIEAQLCGQVVMVTGAAGSIGYEMARQVAKFKPKHLVLVDQAETPMHTARLHMAKHYPDIPCETVVSNINNKSKMESLFRQFRPAYVFHAAAYKHVPMMEDNPSEAIQNNVLGTRTIADLAVKYGTRKFVMISTDKAVNPTNVMGCSKRICEIYCQSLNKAIKEGNCPIQTADGGKPNTQFVTTRFGNVLGSNGSVIPIFRKQIEQGGPLTVTHPDIIRYFMLIPEACRLVLEAGTMGHGGEIFIFDMGKPVRIVDLAQRMIDLSGAKNVKIQFTGLRDGEKLFEEMLNDQELTMPTPHPKIKVAKVREYEYELAQQNEEELIALSYTYDDMAIVKKMKEIVPEYKSQQSKYSILDKD